MNPTENLNEDVLQPQVVELVERAQVDMQIATARKYPRDLVRVKKRMYEFATMDEETAMACFYTVPRDGKKIQGPSVRLAEIAVSCYGNIRAATRLIDNDGKTITAQGICHDLENNVMISVEVKRRITNREGKTFSQDMQVTAGNAASAIALRNAVFKVIPGALITPVYEAAKAVAVGNAATLNDRRLKMLETFAKINVTKEMVLRAVERDSIEKIGLDELAILIGLFNAIKSGDTSIDEAFAHQPTGETPEEINKRKVEEMRNRGGKVTEIRKDEATAPEPRNHGAAKAAEPEPAAETTPTHGAPIDPADTEGKDDWAPEVLGGANSEASISEPAHRTTLRELEAKFMGNPFKAGAAFREILGVHGYESIEQVPDAVKAKPIIAQLNEWLAAKQTQQPQGRPRQSRLRDVE